MKLHCFLAEQKSKWHPFKRTAISDQQRRKELTLERQAQSRRDAQQQARCFASTVLSLQSQNAQQPEQEPEIEFESVLDEQPEEEAYGDSSEDLDVHQASKLKGTEARKWFARYVFVRPAGKHCFVVSSNGTTVSRERNGCILHRFPSALPNGAKNRGVSGPSQSYLLYT